MRGPELRRPVLEKTTSCEAYSARVANPVLKCTCLAQHHRLACRQQRHVEMCLLLTEGQGLNGRGLCRSRLRKIQCSQKEAPVQFVEGCPHNPFYSVNTLTSNHLQATYPQNDGPYTATLHAPYLLSFWGALEVNVIRTYHAYLLWAWVVLADSQEGQLVVCSQQDLRCWVVNPRVHWGGRQGSSIKGLRVSIRWYLGCPKGYLVYLKWYLGYLKG